MKRNIYNILLGIFTIMTAWTVSSCSEEEMFNSNSKDNGFKIEAYLPGSNNLATRVAYDLIPGEKGLKTKWEGNELISVYNISNGDFYTYKCNINESDSSVTWSTEETSEPDVKRGEQLVAVYKPSAIVKETTTTMNFSNQDGTFDRIGEYDLMLSEVLNCDSTNMHFHFARKNVFIRIAVETTFLEDGTDNVKIKLFGKKGCRMNQTRLDITNGNYEPLGTTVEDDNIIINCTNTPKDETVIDDKGTSRKYYLYYVVVPAFEGNIVPIDSIYVVKNDEATPRKSQDYSDKNLVMIPGYIYRTKLTNLNEIMLIPGEEFNAAIKNLINGKSLIGINFDIQSNLKPDNTKDVVVSLPDKTLAYARLISGNSPKAIVTIFTSADAMNANYIAAGMFKDFSELSYFGNFQFLKTFHTTDMSEMFKNCSSLSGINTKAFDTEVVTNMSGMFMGCLKLDKPDLSSFRTPKVTNMSEMFKGCTALTELKISNFNSTVIESTKSMFEDCINLSKLEANANFSYKSNVGKNVILDMGAMFKNCKNLQTLNISNYNTQNVQDMSFMFEGCESLTSIDLSTFNTTKVTTMEKMFYGCNHLNELDLASFRISNQNTSIVNMLYDCTRLTKIILPHAFNLSKQHSPNSTSAFHGVGSESGSCQIIIQGNGNGNGGGGNLKNIANQLRETMSSTELQIPPCYITSLNGTPL